MHRAILCSADVSAGLRFGWCRRVGAAEGPGESLAVADETRGGLDAEQVHDAMLAARRGAGAGFGGAFGGAECAAAGDLHEGLAETRGDPLLELFDLAGDV